MKKQKEEKQQRSKAGKILRRIGIIFGVILLVLCLLLLTAYVEPMFEGKAIRSDRVAGSENWMADLPDDQLISEVALPGTHDSATEYVQLAFFSKCQSLSIGEQLEAGYRYLDIRLGADTDESGNKSLMFMHGFTHCKTGNGLSADNLYLDEVLTEVYAFLDQNPSEGIVFAVKQEHGDESFAEFEGLLNGYIEQNPEYWCLTDTVPTVGQMRGKILLCRRYNDEAGYGSQSGLPFYWLDQSWLGDASLNVDENDKEYGKLYVQDRFEYGCADKWTAFQATLDFAQTEKNEGDILLNFLSSKGRLLYGHPHYFATRLNKKLEQYDFGERNVIGWTIVDFGSPELAQVIYQLNFR